MCRADRHAGTRYTPALLPAGSSRMGGTAEFWVVFQGGQHLYIFWCSLAAENREIRFPLIKRK